MTKANGFQLLTIVAKLSILSAYWVVTASLLCLVQSHQNSPKYTNFFFYSRRMCQKLSWVIVFEEDKQIQKIYCGKYNQVLKEKHLKCPKLLKFCGLLKV